MIYFRNDYSTGAHPAVWEALAQVNDVRSPGYGCDAFCAQAADIIRSLCAAPEADVHFLVGGTQVNSTALAAFLRPYEAAIAAESGHICVHETGAIEHSGHKIIARPTADGKLTPEILEEVCAAHSTEHMVVPRLAYISNTTEVGTVYSLSELRALRAAVTSWASFSTVTVPAWAPRSSLPDPTQALPTMPRCAMPLLSVGPKTAFSLEKLW